MMMKRATSSLVGFSLTLLISSPAGLLCRPSIAAEALDSTASIVPVRSAGYSYLLGPGDRLRMSVFKVEGYAADVEVIGDGTINLPRIGSVQVWGLTIEEARRRITTRYDKILRRPLVYLDLITPRPLSVTVTGEVQRPGIYSIARGGVNTIDNPGTETGSRPVPINGWPTLVDAIQQAGGITALGDLSNIEVIRPSARPGVPAQRLTFNFLTVLLNGGAVENPLIYDGDSISIRRAESPTNANLIAVSSSTFAPDTIAVNVIGEVFRPGLQQIRANSPLGQSITAAGGLTLRGTKHNVALLRLEPDGKTSVQKLVFDPGATLASQNNPPLRNGDVVVVDRSGWTKFNDFLAQSVAPLAPLLSAASIFRLLGGFTAAP